MDEMAVDIEKASAILGLMHQVVIPNLIVKRTRLHGKIPACRGVEPDLAGTVSQGKSR
jgi:hypothetical protein